MFDQLVQDALNFEPTKKNDMRGRRFLQRYGEDTPPKPRWKWHTDQSPKPMPNSAGLYQVGKKKAGCLLDGREWKEFPSE